MVNARIILSDEEQQILNGCLLGDGHLTKTSCKSSRFVYKSNQFDHVNYIYNQFKEYAVKRHKYGPVHYETFSPQTKKVYSGYQFDTQHNIIFYEWRQKWYPESKKIVPRDLELTPLTCLLWYIGDGSLSNNYITLYTNGFSNEDVDFLIKKLYNLSFQPYKGYSHLLPIIIIPRRQVKNFLNYIGECPVISYDYKWDYKDYILTENKQRNRKKVLQLDINNNLIKQWDSLTQIQIETGYPANNISYCCHGQRKTCMGYNWLFAEG